MDTQQLKKKIIAVKDDTTQAINRIVDNRVCVGITGLSRSGKSTFITSLVNQLTHHKDAKLGAFSPWVGDSIIAVKENKLEDSSLAAFPYEQSINHLSDNPPSWPASTDDVSGMLFEIKLKKKGFLGPTTNTVYLELRDYPGEWLLDLPMLNMDYETWCRQCTALFLTEPRHSLIKRHCPELLSLNPLGHASEQQIIRLQKAYTSFLNACKDRKHPLSMIQPGRFLIPGSLAQSSLLNFFPLMTLDLANQDLSAATDTSYFTLLKQRFEHYKKEIVQPFHDKFFSPIDRQIILIDVLNALNGGPDVLKDMIVAIENIGEMFSYGQKGLLPFGRRVEKVIFAATKVDQVISKDHEPVRQLLSSIVKKSLHQAAYHQADYKCEAIASVRSSIESELKNQQGLIAKDTQGQAIGYLHPDIPDHIPQEHEWERFLEWDLPCLLPPEGIRANQDQALPHIRIDQVLQDLIGDICK